MSAVNVDDDMNVEIIGHRVINLTQETSELLKVVTRLALSNDLSGGYI